MVLRPWQVGPRCPVAGEADMPCRRGGQRDPGIVSTWKELREMEIGGGGEERERGREEKRERERGKAEICMPRGREGRKGARKGGLPLKEDLVRTQHGPPRGVPE